MDTKERAAARRAEAEIKADIARAIDRVLPSFLADEAAVSVLGALALAGWGPCETTAAARDLLAERRRQVEKGYDAAHDDQHTKCEIILADWGAIRRLHLATYTGMAAERRELLVQAAAQVVAEIERLDRAAAKGGA